MKKIIIWIAIAAVAVALMIGVSTLYEYLGEQAGNDVPQLTLPQGSSPDTEADDNKKESESDKKEPESQKDPEASVGSDSDKNDTDTNEPETNEPETNESETNEPETNESETNESEPEAPEVIQFNAPDFTVYDQNGNAVKLSDFAGKPIVLNIWATWCYYCTVEMPDFNEMYKSHPDVQFLMVNATGTNGETVESAKKYINDNGFEFPVYYDIDGDALVTYGVTSFPTTILITKSGELVYDRAGMLSAAQLDDLIHQLIELN